jgi:hypothetical protein
MSKYTDKIDIYSIGVILLKTYEHLNCPIFIEYINKLIEFDPELRIDINTAITELDNLLNKL